MPSPADDIARLAAQSHLGASATVPPPRPVGYLAVTKTATYGFLAALPLFVLYEAGIILANPGLGQVRVGADVWLKSLLALLGGTGWAALGGVVLVIGLVVWWRERDRRPALVPRYFAWLVAESLLYAVALAYLVSGTVGASASGMVTSVQVRRRAEKIQRVMSEANARTSSARHLRLGTPRATRRRSARRSPARPGRRPNRPMAAGRSGDRPAAGAAR